MPRFVYRGPYSLLDIFGAILVVVSARFILPPLFEYSLLLHPEDPGIGWIEIVEIVIVLLVLVFLVSKIIEPIRKRLMKKE